MQQLPTKEKHNSHHLEVVYIDKRRLTVASNKFQYENLFDSECESTEQDNLSMSVEKFGLLPDEPLIVVPDLRRKGEGLYLVAKGRQKFLRAIELLKDTDNFPCIVVNKPLSEVQARSQIEELLRSGRAKGNLGWILIKALDESYEFSNRQSTNLSTATKKIIAREAGYEVQHLKSIYRALTPLRRIFHHLISLPENSDKSLIEIMMQAAKDESKQPELHRFLIKGCPSRFCKEYSQRQKKAAEIKREISLTSNVDFVIGDEFRGANYADNGEFDKFVTELSAHF